MLKRSLILVSLMFLIVSLPNLYGSPDQISYQGHLVDSTGVAYNDTSFPMSFKIISSDSTDTLWEESHSSINVDKGLFNVMLGSNNPIDYNFPVDSLLFVVVVDGEELPPPQKMSSVAYSIRSEYSDTSNYSVNTDLIDGIEYDSTLAFYDSVRNVYINRGITDDSVYTFIDSALTRWDSSGWTMDSIEYYVNYARTIMDTLPYYLSLIDTMDSIFYSYLDSAEIDSFINLDSTLQAQQDTVIDILTDTLNTYPLDTLNALWNNSELGWYASGDSAGIAGEGGTFGGAFEGDSAGIYATNSGAGSSNLAAYLDGNVFVDGNLLADTMKGFDNYCCKIHRISPYAASNTDFNTVKYDTIIASETVGHFTFNGDSTAINVPDSGLYQFTGCWHLKNNSGGSLTKVTMRSYVYNSNGDTARCSQVSRTFNSYATNKYRTQTFAGTIRLGVNTSLSVDFQVSNTGLELASDSNLPKPVSATMTLIKISD